MKLYLAGPMTGYPEHNFPKFGQVATQLRAFGHEVMSPAELDGPDFDHDDPAPWAEYLRRDIVELLECEGVFVLPDWENSRGASLEVHIAKELGMPILDHIDKDGVRGGWEVHGAW